MGPSTGVYMLLALGVLIIGTGLPVWALLIGTASLFAALGWATGSIGLGILSALPARLVGLLEHDLLQALPLYVFIGVLLQQLQVADAIFAMLARALRFTGAGRSLAALATGALLAPMNGSVASSSALLTRLVVPQLGRLAPARATALVSVAATIGVVVPPSLVLILLGDALLRAHTEASNLPLYSALFAASGQRIINTQDVLNAALLPAACVLLLWLLVAWWQGRSAERKQPERLMGAAQTAIILVAIAAILALLLAVFTGQMFAVEAAATGGCLLLLVSLLTRVLSASAWRVVLADTLSLSGALLALLVGATTFSLVFRAFATDAWLAGAVLTSPYPPQATALLVLLAIAACAWVLDAFEMIFVIIPILAPPLIAQLGDAQQAAVLLLLVLQLGFLLPPMGYAVLMARARMASSAGPVALRPLLRALGPWLLAQALVCAAVFAWPALVHQLDAPAIVRLQNTPASDADVVRQMEEMGRQAVPDAPANTK